MINNNDDSNYLSIKKEVVEVFRHQNPQGYFHLLYLITDFNAKLKVDEIKILKEDIEKLDQQRVGEINEAQEKLRDQIKSSTKRYEKMLEQNKKQFTDQHELIKTLQAENEIWKNKYDEKKDVNINKVLVWKSKFDELAKKLEDNNAKNKNK